MAPDGITLFASDYFINSRHITTHAKSSWVRDSGYKLGGPFELFRPVYSFNCTLSIILHFA